jgi:RHS repeat-associated protein
MFIFIFLGLNPQLACAGGEPYPPVLTSPQNNANVPGTGPWFYYYDRMSSGCEDPMTNTNWHCAADVFIFQVATDQGFNNQLDLGCTSPSWKSSMGGCASLPNIGSIYNWDFPDNGAIYYWRFLGSNSYGLSYSEVRKFINGPSAIPTAISLVSPSNGTIINNGKVNFAWGAVGDRAADYRLQIATNSNFISGSIYYDSWVGLFGGLNNVSIPDDGRQRFWRVQGKNPLGSGPFSETRNFYSASSVPGAPLLVSPPDRSVYSTDVVLLKWEPAVRGTNYLLQISKGPEFNASDLVFNQWLGDVTGINIDHSKVPDDGRQYYWRVQAKNVLGNGPFSSARSIFSASSPPERPVLLSPADRLFYSGGVVLFKWEPAARGTDYLLEISRGPGFSASEILFSAWLGAVTEKNVDPSLYGGDIFWRVTSNNILGSGPASPYRRLGTQSEISMEAPAKELMGVCVGSSANLSNGNVTFSINLFSALKDSPMPEILDLSYDSSDASAGLLGVGWSHGYEISLEEGSGGFVTFKRGGESRVYKPIDPNNPIQSGYTSGLGDISKLKKIGADNFEITYPKGLVYRFNGKSGKLTSVADRYQNNLAINYQTDQISIAGPKSMGIKLNLVNGKIRSIIAPNGGSYAFDYHPDTGRLWKITLPGIIAPKPSGYWEFQYNISGLLNVKIDPEENKTNYFYDQATNKFSYSLDPVGNYSRVFTYSPEGLTTTVKDENSQEWIYSYDHLKGLLLKKTDPRGHDVNYSYYPDGNVLSITEPGYYKVSEGAYLVSTFYTYDSNGNVLDIYGPKNLASLIPPIDYLMVSDPSSLPFGPSFKYSYDLNNFDRVLSITDLRGPTPLITLFNYDTDPVTSYERITITEKLNGEDLQGLKTVYLLQQDGRLRQVNYNNGQTVTYSYDSFPDGIPSSYGGLLSKIENTSGVRTQFFEYDGLGNPWEVKIVDGTGLKTKTYKNIYDVHGQLKTFTVDGTTGSNVTDYVYDYIGNVTSLLDAQHAGDETKRTLYEYNHKNQLVRITYPEREPYGGGFFDPKYNIVTEFNYSGCSTCNGKDKLQSIIQKGRHEALQVSYEYDDLGRLWKESFPLSHTLRREYLPSGKLSHVADDNDGGKVLVEYAYDYQGQLDSKSFLDVDGQKKMTNLDYDKNGRLWVAENSDIKYEYSYYDNGWPKQTSIYMPPDSSNPSTLTYGYPQIGGSTFKKKILTVKPGDNSESIEIVYENDSRGRLWKIWSSADISGKPFEYQYDEWGRVGHFMYPNGIIADYGYHPDQNWVSSINYKNNNSSLYKVEYQHDKVGNRTQKQESNDIDLSTIYQYDDIYRLKEASNHKDLYDNLKMLRGEAFEYDIFGNRLSGPTEKEANSYSYAYNTANQMTQGRDLSFVYDNYGRQTKRYFDQAKTKYWDLAWDSESRLVQAKLVKDGAVLRTVSFKYDPFDRRIEKKVIDSVGTIIRTYFYEGEDIVLEYVNNGTTSTKIQYVHGPGVDQPLAMIRGGQSYFFHADGLGSIVAMTDANKNIVQRYRYESFGMLTPQQPGFDNAYTYTAREWDKEIGLYYYRARYYDPMEGRFISKDPIGFAGGDVNLYGYVQNNPVNLIDPYGLLNPVKTAVGLTNATRGIKSIATGVGTIAVGTAAIPFTEGVSGPPAYMIGSAQIVLGFANLNRGVQQASEAYSEDWDEATWKNLLGLAPFGQKFDDPCEPGPSEYFSGVWDNIVTDPYDAAKKTIKDFFAFD